MVLSRIMIMFKSFLSFITVCLSLSFKKKCTQVDRFQVRQSEPNLVLESLSDGSFGVSPESRAHFDPLLYFLDRCDEEGFY